MGFFSNWFKQKAKFTDGASECVSSAIHSILMVGKIATSRDLNYLALDESKLKDFVFKYHDTSLIGYHSNSDEFPDCDDFAAIAYSGCLRGAIKEGFKYPPVFGMISVKLKKGAYLYHRLNFAMTSRGQILIYEPQTGVWKTLQDYATYDMDCITGVDL